MSTRFRIQIMILLAMGTSAMFTARGAAPVMAATGSQFFPATGHTVSGSFLAYWQAHGGLANQIGMVRLHGRAYGQALEEFQSTHDLTIDRTRDNNECKAFLERTQQEV